MEFLRENISLIKDLATLIFIGVGTVVTVLTYRRARATILQPIRTEAIKKQAELLSELLQILKENNQSFEAGLDYPSLVQINVLSTLRDYGFIFKQQEELLKELDTKIVSWIPCGKSNILKDVKIIGTFETREKSTKSSQLGVEKYEGLKKEEIDIDKIYLTERHVDFVKIIGDFRNNPFMPLSIQTTLSTLLNDIHNNLLKVLKGELETFMLQFGKVYFEKHTAPSFDPAGVYNSYNHSRIHHRNIVEKLRMEIRKYLLIDEGW